MDFFRFLQSLRGRLITLTVVVEIVMISAILWNSQRLAEEHLIRQFELRRAEISSLLQAALAPAMVQRDYAAVSEILDSAQKLQGMTYLVMFDEDQQRVASSNLDSASPIPAVDAGNQPIFRLQNLNVRIPIRLEQRSYGELQIGIDLRFLNEARQEILLQNFVLAVLGILLSTFVLIAIALWLTRRLAALSAASNDLAAGRPFQPLNASVNDDIGVVVNAFNGMAAALERRMLDLRLSESEQRALAEILATERGRLDALLAAMRLGLVFVAGDGRISYLNPAFLKLWGITPGHQLIDQPVHVLRQQLQQSMPVLGARQCFDGDGSLREYSLPDGRTITEHSVAVISPAAVEGGRLWIFEDVTSQRQIAERLVFMAERDSLTALANRARFDAELDRLLTQAERDPGLYGALIYFDIDEFKTINDTFGHRAGDHVLIRTADTVSKLVRTTELFARLGGDEFAIIAPNADLAGAQSLAERLLSAVAAMQFEFENRRLSLTISVGIALFPEHAGSAEELVSRADAAMYQAKRGGKNGWRLYRPDLDQSEAMLVHLGWNEKIQAALRTGRFLLHFQAIHSTGSSAISHYEALVRMRDPEHPDELLLPGRFIPAAERTGRIVDIDRWVMRAAITKLAENPTLPALAINISARSFDDPTLARSISSLLAEFQVEPRRLIVELTETSALANMHDSEQFIRDIRALGCTVCLDDFGVGFSSFAYLKHLSADVLKIDGMFISNLPTSREDQVFVRAIVDVARGLGKKTVAEFVGDAETLRLLAEIGVDYVQGYYLSRPTADISVP
ncbi:EAL domain-containing protein [Ferribacterium limneticum]|uniref:EAL domain-containing protein n=1 Tax=Ferribacterium limneticum TaxID=76259 RepID=UPI001CF88E9A|nr:EAL domain-containing protein [Ferribacterium limneticum]UCV23058.1 EAL domain-containing protein [Ferribacterium limneticum]